jgi:3-hydroxyisobutyrate dehydrogenase-like beta-hydroxyacid dehydrogenase
MNIGFIGLGKMGHAMATNLLKAGHPITVYNRSPGKAEALVQQGATAARNVAEASTGDVVFTMLSDDEAVEEVASGENGVVASLAPGATHVSSSTISVALSERLAAAHAEAGQQYAAAPVFGRLKSTSAAKLFIVAAGAPRCSGAIGSSGHLDWSALAALSTGTPA